MVAEEIQRRLQALRQAAQDFSQYANLIDNNFESKATEIKALESKRDRLKDEVEKTGQKANAILQDATDQASVLTKQANTLLEEAKISKLQAAQDIKEASQKIAEAQALYQQANQRQREADEAYRQQQEKKKKLEEAMK